MGKYGKMCRFSRRLLDCGSTARAATGALGSKGLTPSFQVLGQWLFV